MNRLTFIILILTMIVMSSSAIKEGLYANDLDIQEDTVTTFASKRAVDKDELDLSEDVSVTFASKRSSKPSITRNQFIKKLHKISNSYVAGELNFFTYDPDQGKLVNIYDNNKVSAKQKFSIQVKSFSGDLYFYAFKVNGVQLTKLFPVKSGYFTSNPIQEYVGYNLPSSKNWYNFDQQKKGKNDFYFFVSQKKISDFNKVETKADLNKLLAKYQERTYTKKILDKNRIKKQRFQGNLYSTMLGFKKVYAKKLSVFVK